MEYLIEQCRNLQNKNKSLYCFDAFYFNKCYLKDEEILYTYDDNVFIKE